MKNVIILGAGRTGSSFLSGLISYRRYYIEQQSIQSRNSYPDGDYENPELKALNKKILHAAGYNHPHIVKSEFADINRIKAVNNDNLHNECADFVKHCGGKSPWLWKDPRLCYTIHFWDQFLTKDDISFIKITRDPYLVFRSHAKHHINFTLKDVVQTYHLENLAVDRYLSENNIPFLHIDYAQLKSRDVIHIINDYLRIEITPEDYTHIRREGITKKESDLKFQMRYAASLVKNSAQSIFQRKNKDSIK